MYSESATERMLIIYNIGNHLKYLHTTLKYSREYVNALRRCVPMNMYAASCAHVLNSSAPALLNFCVAKRMNATYFRSVCCKSVFQSWTQHGPSNRISIQFSLIHSSLEFHFAERSTVITIGTQCNHTSYEYMPVLDAPNT